MESSKDPGTERESENLRVVDLLKKAVGASLGAAFMTEESIRHYVGDLKLPKEAINLVMQGAQKSKEELVSRASQEIVKMISKIDFVSEASKFVEEHKFKINAEIEVVKKSNGKKELAFSLNSAANDSNGDKDSPK